jgi:predicted Zn-dependent peptidase
MAKNATTKVKFTKDGVESEQEVPYVVELAESLPNLREILKTKLTEEEKTSAEVETHIDQKLIDYCNQIFESNARQAARAAFLTTLEGPDKAIKAMAKKLAAVKNITIEEAERAIRAIM